jgi:hypothetical protein
MPSEVNCHSGKFCRISRETSKIRSGVLLQITERRLPDSTAINGTNPEIRKCGFLWMLSENATNEGAGGDDPTCTVSQWSVVNRTKRGVSHIDISSVYIGLGLATAAKWISPTDQPLKPATRRIVPSA